MDNDRGLQPDPAELARSIASGAEEEVALQGVPAQARETLVAWARACGERILELEERESQARESLVDLRMMLEGYSRTKRELRRENVALRVACDPSLKPPVGFDGGLREAVRLADKVADTPIPLLLTGESGTGKEVLARYIHQRSPRADGPFVALNCAAVPEPLLESELFGILKGVASGVTERRGALEEASGGTLLLDEVGDMPPAMQVKLLRVLQEQEVVPVGGRKAIKLDLRYMGATNKDLGAEVAAGRFREDLYYRFVGVRIHLPPLRDRPGDIDKLIERFLPETARRFHRKVSGLGPEALEAMRRYRWPGNVRELLGELERAVAVAETPTITLADLTPRVAAACGAAPVVGSAPPHDPSGQAAGLLPPPGEEVEELRVARARFERAYIEQVLERVGSRRKVAKVLGLTREGLRRKMQTLGIPPGATSGAASAEVGVPPGDAGDLA